MKTNKVLGAAALAGLLTAAAATAAFAVLPEKEAASGETVLSEAVSSLGAQVKASQAQFDKAKARAASKAGPNSADPYVPIKDAYGELTCKSPGWELVNRDYVSPSQPGVVINPSCLRVGGHDRALSASGPNSADPYVPVTDVFGQLTCKSPGWELVNRDYISPSQPGVVINPSCLRVGGREGNRSQSEGHGGSESGGGNGGDRGGAEHEAGGSR